MSFLFNYGSHLLGGVFLSYLGIIECAKLDTACCNKDDRKLLIVEIFASKWFNLNSDTIECSILSLSWIWLRQLKIQHRIFNIAMLKILNEDYQKKFSFCETKSITIVQKRYAACFGRENIDSLVSLVNNCDHLEGLHFQQSMSVDADLRAFFSSVKPPILMHLTSLTIICAGDVVNPALIKHLESKCLHLRSLSLKCCHRSCKSYHLHKLLAVNSGTLERITLIECGEINASFFKFVLCTFEGGNLTELILRMCEKNEVISDYFFLELWSAKSISSGLMTMMSKLQIFSVTFRKPCSIYLPRSSLDDGCGFSYDGRYSSNRQLLLVGLGSAGYSILKCYGDLHEIMMLDMSGCSSAVVLSMLQCNPCLRKFSIVHCSDFTAEMLCLITRVPSVTDLEISRCGLRPDYIEEICFQGNKNLKVIQVCDTPDFKFGNLLNIVCGNRNLVLVNIDKCGMSPLNLKYYEAGADKQQDILKRENANLEFRMKRTVSEIYLLTFPPSNNC